MRNCMPTAIVIIMAAIIGFVGLCNDMRVIAYLGIALLFAAIIFNKE